MTAATPNHAAGRKNAPVRLQVFLRFGDERIEARALDRGVLRLGGRRGLVVPEGSTPKGHVLFRVRRGKIVVRIGGGLVGVARLGGERLDFASAGRDDRKGVREIALGPGDLGLVVDRAWNGAMVEFVCHRATSTVAARRFRPDRGIALALALSAVTQGGFLAVVLSSHPPRRSASVQNPPRRLRALVEALKPKPEPPRAPGDRPSERDIASRRDRAAGGRSMLERRARAKGVLAALRQLGDKGPSRGSLAAVFSPTGELDHVSDASPSLDSLAASIGDGVGAGLSSSGTGKGGGGLGTHGSSMLKASGGPSLGQRRARGIGGTVSRTPARSVRVAGGLDRAEVLKVVNEHMGAVRNCYERALLARPDLEGKLSIEWVVGANGAVTTARLASSSMPEAVVASCILADLRRWTFPKPSGGRAVTVVFPFIFNASGY